VRIKTFNFRKLIDPTAMFAVVRPTSRIDFKMTISKVLFRRTRTPLALATIIAGALLSRSGLVLAQNSMEKQAQCELAAIRDTRSVVAIQFLRSACSWLALNGDSLLNQSSKNYYLCLIRELSGAQADQAAGAIASACRTSYPP
jgi:hypothetical protein